LVLSILLIEVQLIMSNCNRISLTLLCLCATLSLAASQVSAMGGNRNGGGGAGGDSTASTPNGNPAFVGAHYSGSGTCAQCHDGLTDNQGNDISIVKAWSTSMMANAARDPYWKAKVAAELKRNPRLSGVINDKCSRCHAPMANDAASKDGAAMQLLGSGGFLDPANPYFNHAMDAVSCTLCHQIADDGKLGSLEGTSGHYSVATYANAADRPAYGQYTDVLTAPMRMRVQFTPQYGAHTVTSEMCATCHDLKTPFVDSEGNPASSSTETQFPEQMPFTEWSNSDYRVGGSREQSCQGCHMPKVAGTVKIARKPSHVPQREGFSSHEMLGANTVMLDMLASNRGELRVSATGLEEKIERTRAFLRTAADIEVVSASVRNGVLEARLRVTNHTGHKLPTAYPSRRAYIHFLVQDGSGTRVFESGRLNANGSIAGVAVDEDSTQYERHYQVITDEDQVQVYEPIMGDTDGNVTHTLLRGATYLKDNRLLPSGFDKLAVPDDVRVAGAAASDPDFNGGSDLVTYRVPVGNASGLAITAELNYQALSYGHLQDLFEESDLPEVAAFSTIFANRGVLAETIASVSTQVN
jgi:hypothetical protein